MTLAATYYGQVFPPIFVGNPRVFLTSATGGLTYNNLGTVDAATEKMAFCGQVYWDGAPGSAKTMGSSSKVHFRTGAVTFADAGTNVRIGLQDCLTSGTLLSPDGTFDVYADVAGNSGIITSSDDNVAKAITLSTSGSKSVAHGDTIAIVWDMTARAGSDSLTATCVAGSAVASRPVALSNTGSWFLGSGNFTAHVMLEADDGTLGILRGGLFTSAGSAYSYQASSTPDEYGIIFQVPFKCKVDGAVVCMGSNNANADGTLRIYETPLGTPSSLVSLGVTGEQGNASATEAPNVFQFASEITLQPNTDYCLALENTGSAVFDVGYATLASATHRSVMGLANCRRGSRTNTTGAFGETTTEIPLMGVIISALDDGLGGGHASMNLGIY